MTMTNEPPIDTRTATHGDYTNSAQVAQHLKLTIRNAHNWNRLSNDKREALDLIMTKVSRIMSGEPNEPDHWLDIEGYAKLARERVTETSAAREARMEASGHRVIPTVLVKPWDKKS
jgi:hypothetical protein